jgi:AraC-like DNA-binding protein
LDQELTIGPTVQVERATDNFGCPFDKLYKNQTVQGADICFFRKATNEASLEQVVTPASDRGFAIGISTMGGHTRRIFHEHHATTYQFAKNSIYVRNLADPYKADLGGPFDFLLLEISPASLDRIVQESDLAGIFSLDVTTASGDPVLANLVKTMIPALEQPDRVSRLFVDQLASAIGTHIVQQYGGKPVLSKSGRKLSRSHEALAKNILLNSLNGDISILDVARACNLSRGYFIHAFRETTGMTPYRWLQNERISRACELLRTSELSLSEVATACGFADQSHFTRAFASAVGTSPGSWRRNA